MRIAYFDWQHHFRKKSPQPRHPSARKQLESPDLIGLEVIRIKSQNLILAPISLFPFGRVCKSGVATAADVLRTARPSL